LPVARIAWPVGIALFGAALVGCSDTSPVPPAALVGETLEEVDHVVGEREELTRLVQDVSVAVEREPTFDGSQLDSSAWTVVAACADDPDVRRATVLEVAVIPTDTYTASVAEQVVAGEYDDTVSCLWDKG